MKINLNKKNLNIISFLISLIIFSIILAIIYIISNQKINKNYSYKLPKEEKTESISSNNFENNSNVNELVKNNEKNISVNEITNWQIEIEKLNLKTNIAEGISDEVLQNSVGHYVSSNILNGIIALKAYNTGEKNNYFANLKELQIGDEIKYIVNNNQKIYKVVSNKIIDCDEGSDEKNEFKQIFKALNTLNSNENRKEEQDSVQNDKLNKNDILILITYVKDLPNNLRCVIAEKN